MHWKLPKKSEFPRVSSRISPALKDKIEKKRGGISEQYLIEKLLIMWVEGKVKLG